MDDLHCKMLSVGMDRFNILRPTFRVRDMGARRLLEKLTTMPTQELQPLAFSPLATSSLFTSRGNRTPGSRG